MANQMIIKNEATANNFYFWLKDNQQVTNVNGFSLDRTDSGAVAGFYFGNTYHTFDVKYIMKERRSLNDWISTFIK